MPWSKRADRLLRRSGNGPTGSLPPRGGGTDPEDAGLYDGFTLDAGALIALDRKDRRVLALIARAQELGARITIPATALAQAIRNPARQVLISRLSRQAGTDLVPLDGPDATAVGLLLARTATADIADAHVVVCALRAAQAVITSDPDDLKRISPDLPLITV